MFYRDENIDELMPDILVQDVDASSQPAIRYSISYFLKSRSKKSLAETELSETYVTPHTDNSIETNEVQATYNPVRGTLPESVYCHPTVGYAYRYGIIMLCGLDNDMDSAPINNGSWRP